MSTYLQSAANAGFCCLKSVGAQWRFAFFAGFSLLVFCSPLQAADEAGPVGREGSWKRVFTDEFDGRKLDRRKWTTCYWWDDHGCTNLGTGEIEWYRPGNVAIRDGVLELTARPEPVVGIEGRKFPYTSGMVTSGRYYREEGRKPRFAFHRGYIEVRARIPSGKGLWPAIWLLPTDHESRPEIDIMEVLGDKPGVLEMHYHYRDAANKRQSAGSETKHADLSQDWHVYGLEWRKDALIYYLDGVEQWRFKDVKAIPDEPMYLLMNLAVGGEWPGNPDKTTVFPAHFRIDYVRAWQPSP